MSCDRDQLLEALVGGELRGGAADELQSHLKRCARCRHELNWLRTEASLLRQRAGREEVAHLWNRWGPESASRPPRGWRPMAASVGLVAVLLALLVGVMRLPSHVDDAEPPPALPMLVSQPTEITPGDMSEFHPERDGESASRRCSMLPEGLGFHCGPVHRADALASR